MGVQDSCPVVTYLASNENVDTCSVTKTIMTVICPNTSYFIRFHDFIKFIEIVLSLVEATVHIFIWPLTTGQCSVAHWKQTLLKLI